MFSIVLVNIAVAIFRVSPYTDTDLAIGADERIAPSKYHVVAKHTPVM
jgi:hypothetical protein